MGTSTTWRRAAWLLPIAAAAAVFGIVWGTLGVGAQAASYAATLSGANVVPALESGASGSFTATFDGTTINYTLTVSGIEGASQAHIHIGAADENGGVAAFLFGPVDEGVSSINVSGAITEADLLGDFAGDMDGFAAAIAAGNTYVQVHTAANPGGEVRGQIGAAVSALPSTGSGGLAGSGGTGAWVWALIAAGVTFGLVTTFRAGLVRIRR